MSGFRRTDQLGTKPIQTNTFQDGATTWQDFQFGDQMDAEMLQLDLHFSDMCARCKGTRPSTACTAFDLML